MLLKQRDSDMLTTTQGRDILKRLINEWAWKLYERRHRQECCWLGYKLWLRTKQTFILEDLIQRFEQAQQDKQQELKQRLDGIKYQNRID
jgi:hypothetical protein